ncbi:hypothetical protein [Streptomyces monashensis]|uniref:Uncharacterized protein n=1 Tax=Streptomyces monashensis TaxID=1678012 RepID=A0A1S2NYS6_9ACTN|nr:hypothetical protein [Streptomyces monashensis]OIJ86629.1 hypothetical protein BIV23_43835 [Streptomyces monashensis]
MNHGLRRISGLAVLIAGIALGAWVAFGSPHHWHGAKVLGRTALGLGSLTMITGSSRLLFPGGGGAVGGRRM